MKSVLRDANGGYPPTGRKLRKLRTESSRTSVGCTQRVTPCPTPVQEVAEERKPMEPMNGSPVPGNPNPGTQDIAKDVGSTTQEARLQALRTELWKGSLFQNAGEAYRTLAKQGCDMGVAMGYVRRVAGYKRGNGRRTFQIPPSQAISRKARLISRQLTKLANRAAELRKIWGFWEHMVDADAIHVPEELMNIAARLSCLNAAGFGDWFPQQEALLDLLDLVRTATRRPHYVEVSLLMQPL